MCPTDSCQMWICLLWVRFLGDVNLWCMSYVNMWCSVNNHTCLTKFLEIGFFYLRCMMYYTSSRVVLYLTTILVLRPTQAHSRYVSREGRHPHAVSSHSPSCHRRRFLPLAFVTLISPTPRCTLHPFTETRSTPRSTRRAPHLWYRDLEEEGPNSISGDNDDN
jgi:hypothetical protein